MSAQPHYDVVVVGAGFAGIGAAIKLDEAGFKNFIVLEEGDGIGGAWHWNTYPGVAVDIPSFSYQFSFAQRSDWSRIYAPGNELKAYAEDLVDGYGLRSRIKLNARVVGQEFDEAAHTWRVVTEAGEEFTSRYVIDATGVITQPKIPDIKGLGDFAGPAIHTARWDHRVDLTGKRVAVIGTGASSVQVVPAIASEVDHVIVFQRTPVWCLPKADVAITGKARFAVQRIPGARRIGRLLALLLGETLLVLAVHYAGKFPRVSRKVEELARKNMGQANDPDVRAKLTPDYTIGCKRHTASSEYPAIFNRDNVHLETKPIDTVKPGGIHLADGTKHEVDIIILATGFKGFEKGNMPPFPVLGVDGTDLTDWWDENRYQAYQGVSIPTFPNYFMTFGPYGYNGASYFHFIETQMRHIPRCLKHARKTQTTRVEVTRTANERYFASVLKRRRNQVFFTGNCATSNSHYFDKHGDVPFRPSTSIETLVRSATFRLNAYSFTK
ncbi:MAG TPA: NAD(P)/FAD-dependent oxidoreductase [Mycobacterium sp.]|nr:NAD(P)/FAD-dependent oxidoreductase [Mycobacterium sp.]